MYADDVGWEPDVRVQPVGLPPGFFRPLMCCVCGRLLPEVRYPFSEGTLCCYCYCQLPQSTRDEWRDWPFPEGGGK